MSFLHAWAIAIGAAAVALPLAVHWLTKPRPVRMPLPTLRFLREAVSQRRTRHRLRDFIILLLRAAAIVLLALALARPQDHGQASVADDSTGQTLRVVVLDVSQSMAATQGGVSALERGRAAAAEWLRYRPGLRADLLLAAADPGAVFDRPSTNFDALREGLAGCAARSERLNLARAIEESGRLLAGGAAAKVRRELVLVSDFQRTNWTTADFAPLPADTIIQFESVAAAEALANVGIVRASGRPIGPGSKVVAVEAEIGNFSPTPRKVQVEFHLGEDSWTTAVTCPPGQTSRIVENRELRKTGWQSGEVRLLEVDDALAADNRRPLALHLAPTTTFALVTRESARMSPSESHFLQCALAPAADSGSSTVEVARLHPADLRPTELFKAQLAVVARPGALSASAVQALVQMLRRGRSVLYVANEAEDATNLRQIAEAAGAAWQMPVEFAPLPPGRPRRAAPLGEVRGREAPFAVFGDQLPAVVEHLRFSGGLRSRALSGAVAADCLATYRDGAAFLTLAPVEAGTFAVLNADLAISNLAQSRVFVPFLQELVDAMLGGDRTDPTAPCGEPLVLRLPVDAGPAEGLVIRTAEARAKPSAAAERCEIVDEATGPVLRWNAPERVGVYPVYRGPDMVFAAAVALPAEESDLESLTGNLLTERIAGQRTTYFRGAEEQNRTDDLWIYLAAACVACMLGEWGALIFFRT